MADRALRDIAADLYDCATGRSLMDRPSAEALMIEAAKALWAAEQDLAWERHH